MSALSGDLRLSWQQSACQPPLDYMFCGLAMLSSIDLLSSRANLRRPFPYHWCVCVCVCETLDQFLRLCQYEVMELCVCVCV